MIAIRQFRQARAFATLPAVAGLAFLLLALAIYRWPQLVWWMFILLFALIGVGLIAFSLKMKAKTPSH